MFWPFSFGAGTYIHLILNFILEITSTIPRIPSTRGLQTSMPTPDPSPKSFPPRLSTPKGQLSTSLPTSKNWWSTSSKLQSTDIYGPSICSSRIFYLVNVKFCFTAFCKLSFHQGTNQPHYFHSAIVLTSLALIYSRLQKIFSYPKCSIFT